MQRAYHERRPTAEAYKLRREPQSLLVVIIIISIINLVTCKVLIMKGVRRQRHTCCMTMMTMRMAKFILVANVASNVPAAQDRICILTPLCFTPCQNATATRRTQGDWWVVVQTELRTRHASSRSRCSPPERKLREQTSSSWSRLDSNIA